MESDKITFELTRLHRLLLKRLIPGCAERTFAQQDIEDLMKEISWEGEKVCVGVMKRMCQPHGDEHMRRYMAAHIISVEDLREQLAELAANADELCREVFEVFDKVLVRVEDKLIKWQQLYFGTGIDPKDWLTKAQVEEELHITQSTFYRYKKKSKWKTKLINGAEHYLKSSLYD